MRGTALRGGVRVSRFFAAVVGGLAAVLVALALASRWVEEPLVAALAPVVDGDRGRGFAVGLASGVLPWFLAWWLLVGRHRRSESPGDLDQGEASARLDRPPETNRARTAATLVVSVLCFATVVPFLVLGPAGRNPRPETVRAEQAEARRLPGVHPGQLTALFAGGLLVIGHWAHTSSPRRRPE